MAESRRKPSGLGNALDGIVTRFLRREPRQLRSRAVVEAAVQAIDDLIRRGAPIEEVTVERVSARAGIGIASFYEYFASKDSVLGILIGRVTRANFEELSRKLDALEHDSVDDLIRAFADTVVDTYLAHPNRTRVIIEGIGRLGLTSLVHDEKDRFANVMAVRVSRYFPAEPFEALATTMRLVADAGMGVLGFAAMRGGAIDHALIAREIAALANETLERRHPRASR